MLFRRIATKTRKDPVTNEAKELFSTLTGEQRLVIRQKLVTCLTTESVADVRRKVGDSVAEIARQYTDNGMRLWLSSLGETVLISLLQAINGRSSSVFCSRPVSPPMRACARPPTASSRLPPGSSRRTTRMPC